MGSLTIPPRTSDYSADPSPQNKVDAGDLDTDIDSIHAALNAIKDRFNVITRSDDQLKDFSIREWMLHPEILENFGAGGNTVNIYPGGGSSGGQGYNVKDSDFGAIGDGLSHPLTAEDAAVMNTLFSSYGAQGANAFVAGDEKDYAAIQAALWKAANTGEAVYIPPGTFRANKPLSLSWTATPIMGQPVSPKICLLHGSGKSSVIIGYGIVAGRGVVECLGESNANAANIEIANLQIEEDASCHKYSFCLRLGDGYCGINLHRVICKGAQGLALRVASSVTYAQICFSAYQCQFWSNWDLRWGADNGSMDVYAVVPESLGSYWDLAKFDSCFFWGQVDCRAFNLKFESSMFINQVGRATNFGATVYLGTAAWDNCYFEDHLVAIATNTATALVPITNIAIRNCHFSSVNNSGSPANAQSSIQCARVNAEHGPVIIENCRFGGTATYSDIDLYGPITVTVNGCCRPFLPGINTAPSITTAGDVRLITRNPNGEQPFDVMEFTKVKVKCAEMIGPLDIEQDVNGGATVRLSNPNVGNVATAAVEAESGDVVGGVIAYHDAHPLLPSHVVLNNSDAAGKLGFSLAGLLRLTVDETWVKSSKSFNAGYGLAAENVNGGAGAYSFSYVYNGVAIGGAHCYGTGHPFANQIHIGSFTSHVCKLVAGTSDVAMLDPATRRMLMRDNGIVGGDWYIQTATQTADNTVAEIVMMAAGLGNIVIPANTLQVGSQIEIDTIVTEETIGAVTMAYRFYAGGAILHNVAFGGGAAVAPRSMTLRATVKSIGAGGSLDWVIIRRGDPATYGTQAINTTIAQTMYMSVQPSVAAVGNKVTCPQARLRVTI